MRVPADRESGVLPDLVRELLREERMVLGRLRERLAIEAATADDVGQLRQAELDLDELFLLVVVGEFNSGKSAFINALLGARVLREGVTPTTAVITRLRYAPAPNERREGPLLEVGYPLDLLRDVAVVDTPGTNAIVREHEEITSHFVPRADLVLFVTSADRPFTETERAFMERIRTWGKKVVVVLNKVDLLGPEQVVEQMEFVRQGVERLLGFRPEVFPVSARLALSSKIGAGGGAEWTEPLPGTGGLRQRDTGRTGRLRLKTLDSAWYRRAYRADVCHGSRGKAGAAGRRPGAGGVHRPATRGLPRRHAA